MGFNTFMGVGKGNGAHTLASFNKMFLELVGLYTKSMGFFLSCYVFNVMYGVLVFSVLSHLRETVAGNRWCSWGSCCCSSPVS